MEPCWDYLGCSKIRCVMYGRTDGARCWETPGTLCNHPGIERAREIDPGDKKRACEHARCIYFRHAIEIGEVRL